MPGPWSPTLAALGSSIKTSGLKLSELTLDTSIISSQEKALLSKLTTLASRIATDSGPEIKKRSLKIIISNCLELQLLTAIYNASFSYQRE